MLGQAPSPARSASRAGPTRSPKPKPTSQSPNGCLVLAVLFIALVGLFAFLGALGVTGDDDDDDADVTPALAFEMCKDFVRERLRAPGSAVFRNYYEDDGEVVVTGSGSGPYTVRSSVDSQNGFGALLRNEFTCTVTNTVGDTWRLDDLAIGE